MRKNKEKMPQQDGKIAPAALTFHQRQKKRFLGKGSSGINH